MPRDGILEAPKGTRQDSRSLPEIRFRAPTAEDGSDVWALVQDINALDDNSMYCNLLQCTHFAETCALAECDGRIVGWVSGYRPPSDPDTLFIWQVAVHPSMRGRGVAKRLIQSVLDRPQHRDVTFLHSTITRDNKASWALFTALATGFDATMNRDVQFDRERHFDGEASTEYLVRIGPLRRPAVHGPALHRPAFQRPALRRVA